MIKKYLVGGAVRDRIMGIPTNDNDYVVVGSTPDEMIELGFKPIGKDFPVFLHPETHEEYALARTEKKISKGYHGFEFYALPDISLEEDLKRRDITINAIAMDESNKYIDPFQGIKDIEKKIIRHVSDSFIEDPIRVIRVARFKARFPDFSIHRKTLELLNEIVENKEIQTISSERIVDEIKKALSNSNLMIMLDVLNNCGALEILFPKSNYLKNKVNAHNFFDFSEPLNNPLYSLELFKENKLILLILWMYLDGAKIKSNILNIAKKLKLPSKSQKIINLIKEHLYDLSQIDKISIHKQFDFLVKFDFFRRPEILETCVDLTRHLLNINDQKNNLKNFMDKIIKFREKLSKTNFDLTSSYKGKELGEKIKSKRFEIFKNIN